ncbi:MAG TPA: hypothetical protein VLJ59_17085 [Mycobacteriales bacterium]|nr:hypothetical protein [Mycobacteriales bacterium]
MGCLPTAPRGVVAGVAVPAAGWVSGLALGAAVEARERRAVEDFLAGDYRPGAGRGSAPAGGSAR